MIAVNCRRLAEMAAIDLLAASKRETKGILKNLIESVCNCYSLAGWKYYYFNIMREFGNEGAHIRTKIEKNKNVKYHHPNENDINILIVCSAEILNTWRTIREKV